MIIGSELKPCPFCGSEDINMDVVIGTQLEIYCEECGINNGLQKSDNLTREEDDTWDSSTCRYSDEAEQKVRQILIDKWNTRVKIT